MMIYALPPAKILPPKLSLHPSILEIFPSRPSPTPLLSKYQKSPTPAKVGGRTNCDDTAARFEILIFRNFSGDQSPKFSETSRA